MKYGGSIERFQQLNWAGSLNQPVVLKPSCLGRSGCGSNLNYRDMDGRLSVFPFTRVPRMSTYVEPQPSSS